MMHNSSRILGAGLLAMLCGFFAAGHAVAQSPTVLADQPVFGSVDVPGNMVFTLSVEFPTALSIANYGNYDDTVNYYGYFDPVKCYTYLYNSMTPASSYFEPEAMGSGTNLHFCTGMWSGNFMNWATTQTIDPFRAILTGGYRNVDTTTQTILEKAWGSHQGGLNNFPNRGTTEPANENISSALIPFLTPFSNWTDWDSTIWNEGNQMTFYSESTAHGSAVYTGSTTASRHTQYSLYVRVSVCDYSTMGLAGIQTEGNCVGYGPQFVNSAGATQYTIYKPEGLMQKYSNKIQYSVFSYLQGYGTNDQGGVMRAPMGFIGPTYPQPLSSSVVTNTRPEWDPNTGIMYTNPDTVSAAGSGVMNSGAMNYINQFGETSRTYETYDNVSELYYAAVRYYENMGNVPEWLANVNATTLDGFPAVPSWTDPISYYCQKNFILGIGDDHTWVDYNTGGSSVAGSNVTAVRPVPPLVTADSFNTATKWLTDLQNLEGISPNTPWWNECCGGATEMIAGLAYGIHTVNIRPDLTPVGSTTPITVSTYWLDVAEDQEVENLNPYYLATKYGGFSVPSGYNIGSPGVASLPLAWYDTSGRTVAMNGGHSQNWPDNYFIGKNSTQMRDSLSNAFSYIAAAIHQNSTSFSLSSPNVTGSGGLSFAATYNSSPWFGTVQASTLTLSATSTCASPPCQTPVWTTDTTLPAQFAGTGWQSSRNVVTWNGTTGVAFEPASLSTAQLNALQPSYASTVTSTMYLDWLRGDQTNEVGSTATTSTHSLRARTKLLGDIVDASLLAVSTPQMNFSGDTNPGYPAFASTYASRATMVYAGANDGMLHAFVGTAIGSGATNSAGSELFAYVPSGTFQGPNGTPQVNGLAELGNPNFTHYYYVDATPGAFDIDLNRVDGASAAGTSYTPNWRTVLIGGMGKGGRSYYAIDVTDPTTVTSESAAAGNVLWEFTDPSMGYSFGLPTVVKTVQYGWVAIFTSGYDDGGGTEYGYIYIVNPANGQLLQKIQTPSPSVGLSQGSAYVQDYTDYTADAFYVGDLNGQVWRLDLTPSSGNYSPPTLIATLTDPNGNPQPITTAPLAEIHPVTRKRYILVGTGQLLSAQDVSSAQVQTFYGILDGTAPSGTFKHPITTPAKRGNMTAFTDLLTANVIPSGSDGWYYDMLLPPANTGGLRVITQPTDFNGIVIWSATNPTVTDPCAPSGSSALFAADFATGLSVLNGAASGSPFVPVTSVSDPNLITNINVLNQGGAMLLLTGDNKGNNVLVNANLTEALATRILNWSELPTAE